MRERENVSRAITDQMVEQAARVLRPGDFEEGGLEFDRANTRDHARAIIAAAFEGLRLDGRLGSDGAGSYPSNPATDRPQSRWVRLVGPWVRL